MFWMGEGLTPWMENALETLANNAKITTLLEQEKTTLLDFRESALFEEHDPDEHGDEEPGEKEGHDEHGHEMHDPHAWLSLENANTWLNLIAAQLSGIDPKMQEFILPMLQRHAQRLKLSWQRSQPCLIPLEIVISSYSMMPSIFRNDL